MNLVNVVQSRWLSLIDNKGTVAQYTFYNAINNAIIHMSLQVENEGIFWRATRLGQCSGLTQQIRSFPNILVECPIWTLYDLLSRTC